VTPVIAHARGSMPELIDDGRTGLLVTGADGAVDAVDRAGRLDRSLIRSAAVERFDVGTMVDRYVAVYRAILDGLPAMSGREGRSHTSSSAGWPQSIASSTRSPT
jgi:glycosyltransferase involved in cell wall biosynthesis